MEYSQLHPPFPIIGSGTYDNNDLSNKFNNQEILVILA